MKREFTHSELASYQDCPQKWWFKYHERLVPDREKTALSFGRLMHESLGMFYVGGIDKAIEYLKTKTGEALSEAEDEELKNEIMENDALGIGMLNNYEAFATAHNDFTVKNIEKQYTVPILAPTGNKSSLFEYTFRPDMIDERNGQIWIHEFKTAASIGRDYLDNLMLDEQMSRYCWALEKATGQKVEGVIYDILRKKLPVIPQMLKNGGLSKSMSIDTTHDVYMKAIKDNGLNPKDYADILMALETKGNTFIVREQVMRNDKEKKSCEGRLWTLCKTINTDPPIYKCPSRDCSWKCDFRVLCIEDTPEARSVYKIRDDYHPETIKEG